MRGEKDTKDRRNSSLELDGEEESPSEDDAAPVEDAPLEEDAEKAA